MADKSVFILEPDDRFNRALKLYFRGSGFEAVAVENADEALALAGARRPDIMITAIEEEADGRELLALLTSNPATAGVPLVVMSKKKDEQQLFAEGVQAVGATAYIKKPFIKKAILTLLEEVLGGGTPSASSGGGKAGGGSELNTIFSELDDAVDNFFEDDKADAKAGDTAGDDGEEFTVGVEEDEPAPELEPIALALDDEPVGGANHFAGGRDAAALVEPGPVSFDGDSSGAAFEATADEGEPRSDSALHPAGVTTGEFAKGDGLKRLRARILELEQQLQHKSEEFKSVAREKERVEQSVGKKESELVERIQALDKQVEDLEEDVKKRKQLVAQMTASVQQLNDDLEEKDRKHANEVGERQAHLSRIQTELDEAQEKSSQQAHEIEDRKEEVARLGRRIEDLEAERSELQANLEQMTSHRDQLNAQIEAAQRQFETGIDGLRSTLQQQMAEARSAIESGLATATESLQQSITLANETIGAGLQQTAEAVERTQSEAQQVLDAGRNALHGRN